MQDDISEFMSGMKRTVAAERAQSGVSLDEGKKAMKFEVYKKMCHLLYRAEGVDYSFAHAFLTLEWNLMARADNCFSMQISHIEWSDDSLVFFFAKSKSDQEGARSENP